VTLRNEKNVVYIVEHMMIVSEIR